MQIRLEFFQMYVCDFVLYNKKFFLKDKICQFDSIFVIQFDINFMLLIKDKLIRWFKLNLKTKKTKKKN